MGGGGGIKSGFFVLMAGRCTQCSVLLQLIDIFFLTCICLWQLSQIQTCLRVFVGPGFVSTSPAFMRSSTSNSAGSHDWLAQKKR